MKKRVLSLFFFITAALFAEESPYSARADITALLSAYLANDLQLQKLSAEVQKQKLSAQSTAITNGLAIQLSTGTIVFKTGKKAETVFKPTASVGLPQADNISLSVASEVTGYQGNSQITDTSFKLSADIISEVMDTRKVALLKAQRTVLEAERALQNRAVSAEKEFYTSLDALYTTAVSIVEAQKELYDDTISFEEIKAKGYSASSSKYRSAEMEVVSDEHTVQTKQHELERETAVFASKCGTPYTGTDARDFLPDIIPPVAAIDIQSFDKEQYTETETARWTNRINTLTRKASKNFTLSGNAGYTLNNADTDSNTVDTGVSAKICGLSVSAGVSVPVPNQDSSTSPAYTLGVSLNPSTFALAGITAKQNTLAEKQETIAIETAQNDYNTSVITQQTSLADIIWNKKSNTESYTLYEALESDTAKWYKAGIVTESEYLSAKVNREKYELQSIINDIELIIYNDTTRLLFCRDGEIQAE